MRKIDTTEHVCKLCGSIISMKRVIMLKKGINSIDTTMRYKQPCYAIKPNGLWYSFNHSWEVWLSLNDLNMKRKYGKTVELHIDTKNIFVFDDFNAVSSFDSEFSNDRGLIDWVEVSKIYDGVETTENYTELIDSFSHHKLKWFTYFDVPSGCIWNLDVIIQ